ncbi:MAG TPA: Rossmann-like and DUF2520 domain-containing protein [Candidatus Dormibacteraeota bacterium]|nr:Rossmann-like and DUF2520 domain-containing protein [Candidatus Dormibacteraeota bacterium]
MLPGMAAKPSIAIVGAGNLGTALAVSLQRAGYAIEAVMARSGGKSLARTKSLAKQIGARAVVGPKDVTADVLWLCVPDSEIRRAAEGLAGNLKGGGKIALHSSGALTSDELGALRGKGFAVASVHPLMTFVRGSRPSLAAVPFAIEGDAGAVRVARHIVRDLGGTAYAIRKKDKVAYHAWGAFASPMLTALLATSERVAAAAGVKRKDASRRMIPILLQTLANYASFGAPGAFSGPIVRGDVETVKRHLRVLRRVPAARKAYSALVQAALQFLPAKNKNELKRLLES